MGSFPKITYIHQILLLKNAKIPEILPPEIQRSQSAVRSVYPEASYRLWDRESIEKIIKKYMSDEVLFSFNTLKPMAYQADLARYVLLYVFGGLYVDLGVVLQKRWTFAPHKKIAACRDAAFISPSWTAIQNGLLWAQPGRREFYNAIKSIYRNCMNYYYGSNPLYPTGPVLLGKSFVDVTISSGLEDLKDEQDIGQCVCLTPEASSHNLTYISRSGDFIALRTKKLAGDLTHMGIINGNNYNNIWNARCVYGEKDSDSIIKKWSAGTAPLQSLGRAKQSNKGIEINFPMKGRINIGPYERIPLGKYCLEVLFTKDTKFFWVKIEMASGPTNRIVQKKICFFRKNRENFIVVSMSFSLTKMHDNIEFRVVVNREFQGTLVALHLLSPDIGL